MSTATTDRPGPPQRQRRADGERTRGAILRAAASLATVDGLDGLSIGNLAAATGISKSGLYAHFGSKQEMQLATVEEAERILDEEVVQPALAAPDGLQRLAAACEAFFSYVERRVFPGGCFFAATAMEMGTRPGPVRDRIAAVQSGFTALPGFVRGHRHRTARASRHRGSRRCSPSSSTRSCWAPTPTSSCTTTPEPWNSVAGASGIVSDWTAQASRLPEPNPTSELIADRN